MIDCLLQREKKEKVSLHLYAQVFTDLGAVIFRSEALRFGASVAMTKVRPKAGTGAVTFPKPVFCGCFFFFFLLVVGVFFLFGGGVFFFNSFEDLHVLCRDCPRLMCPRGWGKHQFHYEFQLQTWLCSSEGSEKRTSGG